MRLRNLIVLIACEIALDPMCTVHAANEWRSWGWLAHRYELLHW